MQAHSSATSLLSTGSTDRATTNSSTFTLAEKALGRKSRHLNLSSVGRRIPSGSKILITGSKGSIGTAFLEACWDWDWDVRGVDTEDQSGDVLAGIGHVIDEVKPDVIFHLAAAKHAPVGEIEPYETAFLNIEGTRNVLRAAKRYASRVVLASTCKAINPETAYGASKLIAERMTLNYANGAVARFHNVVETQGNVFEIWDSVPEGEKIEATDCIRYFLTKDEALSLLLYAATAKPGLYTFRADNPQYMPQIAERLYDRSRIQLSTRRRGDRKQEPFKHDEEVLELVDGPICKLWNPHAGN